jgi:hypothetical protein
MSAGDADSLLVEIVQAPAGTSRRRPVGVAAPSQPPAEVSLVVATLVLSAGRLPNVDAAASALKRWREDPQAQQSLLQRALAVLNTAARAYRAAAIDPYVVEVMELDPRAVRLGYGAPGEIGAGAWLDAFPVEVPEPAVDPRSAEQLRIGETVGAVLAGRAAIFEAEDLALRALLDLEHRRIRAAVAQARAAVEVLKEELGAWGVGEALESVTAVESLDPDLISATALHVLETAAAYRAERLHGRPGPGP